MPGWRKPLAPNLNRPPHRFVSNRHRAHLSARVSGSVNFLPAIQKPPRMGIMPRWEPFRTMFLINSDDVDREYWHHTVLHPASLPTCPFERRCAIRLLPSSLRVILQCHTRRFFSSNLPLPASPYYQSEETQSPRHHCILSSSNSRLQDAMIASS